MQVLKLFLKVLEEYYKDKGIIFIDKLQIIPQRPVPAYKEYILEVYCKKDKEIKLYVKSSQVYKSTSDKQDEEAKEKLIKEIILNILNKIKDETFQI